MHPESEVLPPEPEADSLAAVEFWTGDVVEHSGLEDSYGEQELEAADNTYLRAIFVRSAC